MGWMDEDLRMEVACVVQLIQDKVGHSGKPNFISCYFELKHIFPLL
jgi:hypothetical protein